MSPPEPVRCHGFYINIRSVKLGRICPEESITVAAVIVMEATCIGLVEEVDALGGDVHGQVEERPNIKRIGRCSSKNWYMVLERGPVEGRPGFERIRRCSSNRTGDQGGRPTRSLRSSESAVDFDEGKKGERCERRFLWEGQSLPGSPVDRRPWQGGWTGLPRHWFWGHWRWTRAVCIPGRNPEKFFLPQDWTTSTPGEQCRTQVPVSAGSGDLRPTLDEEIAPPLVQDQCAVFHCNQQRYTVLVNVVTEFLVTWCTTKFLATLPTIKCLQHASTVCSNNYSSWLFFEAFSTIHGSSSMHTMVMTTIQKVRRLLLGECVTCSPAGTRCLQLAP